MQQPGHAADPAPSLARSHPKFQQFVIPPIVPLLLAQGCSHKAGKLQAASDEALFISHAIILARAFQPISNQTD